MEENQTHPSSPPSPSLPPDQPPQSQPEEPNPKKLKMSTSDDDDNEPQEGPAALQRKPRYKRRKIAMFFAYCGVGYQGMQKNPGAKTIEGDLEEALFHAGAVPEQDRGCPKRFDWARSARTDKGVSAVGQVVSGRFYIDPPGLVDRLNSILPPQIRIFGYKRVTQSFNAKKFCDRRRYVYLIPVFALDPSCHRDRESVLASLGSENELVKCFECSERGRKVVGIMGKRNFESKTGDVVITVDSGISSNMGNAEVSEELVTPSAVAGSGNNSGNLSNDSMKELEDGANASQKSEGDKVMKKTEFCYGPEEKERFNRILKYYQGTHNFHNFTTRTKAEDPSARRYIISFEANTTVIVEGLEFVKCEVVGQSFMLHQIRKMIGLAIVIMRNAAPESLIEFAFRQ